MRVLIAILMFLSTMVAQAAGTLPEDQIVGNEGEIFCWNFENNQLEAEYIANQVEGWIKLEGIPHSEIAILLSKQIDLYTGLLITELEKRSIPYRNEQQLQDISVEPAARLIIDYLLSLYGVREPAAWLRLMDMLIPFLDEQDQADIRQDWQSFIKSERKEAAILDLVEDRWPTAWTFARNFLKKIGIGTLTGLSPDYESSIRLKEVIQETKKRIEDILKIEPDLLNALARFSADQAVRILTIHKSKGLEFDSVIILGVEKETFWGNQDENRCAFFVGVSRAKRRLVLTTASTRPTPVGANRWNESRHPQEEYIGYLTPLIDPSHSL